MKVVLPLGNPGSRYATTRHNIGWLVADAVAALLRTEFRPGKGNYYEAKGEWRGEEFLLVKPTTYMNNSGLAAVQVAERYGTTPADTLVIVDEIQFPVGKIQLKPSGSSGGHNGTESVIYHLQTLDVPRLRCGVGNNFRSGEMVDYVLSDFPDGEIEIVEKMIAEAADLVLTWIAEGTARAMNRSNNREKKGASEASDTPPRTEI